MFNWLKRNTGRSRFLGLEMYEDGFAVAVIDRSAASSPVICAARWCPVERAGDRGAALKRVVRELDARGLPVVGALQHSSYSLVQLEAPELESDELREAMRWRVKDLIDFPVDEAVIDVFHLPESRRPGAPGLIYVVVAKSSEVEALGGLLVEAGLRIEAIDIVEMSIRNLAMHLDKPGRPRAYLNMQPGQTIIEIVDDSQVYLSRRVLQDYDADADAEILRAQMENLALEVQRSLDYFESQYALGPADQLSVMVPQDLLFSAFSTVAQAFLTVQTVRFSISDTVLADGVSLSGLDRGVTAIGSAMRGLPWAA